MPASSDRFERYKRLSVLQIPNSETTSLCRCGVGPDHERPYDALALQTPATRYRARSNGYSPAWPVIDYPEMDTVAVVKHNGEIHFKGHQLRVCSALLGLPIAFGVCPKQDGCYEVYFCGHRFMPIDLNTLKAAH